ncbi:MAG: ABC transporter substrate-binding protein [Oscillospiraceae bacterium]|nr:ABC transporter substrate-binding protein [Oscillospiraceae bacterium]
MKRFVAVMLIIVLALSLTACGTSASEKTSSVIKIGYVNPTTGALAGNGEGCAWVVKKITDYVAEHPITVDGQKKTIQVIVYDSASDQNTCSEMAQKLIEEDKIDLMIAIQTPNTVIPVAQVAERYGVPCIATQSPVDPLAESLEKFKWTCDAFYTLDQVYESQRALWTQAGNAPGSGAKVGLLFANDADGTAWHELFVRRLAEDGYEAVDPGQYPSRTTDFSNVAAKFKSAEIDVIAGTNIPPDFMNAYSAIISAGVRVDCVTMGKCCLLQSDVEALGELADGIMTQVWWDPAYPYTSGLTGIGSEELNRMYAEENNGRTMPQPAAYAYAALELAVHTFEKAGTTRREAVRDAIRSLDVTTIVGHVKYDQQMKGLTYACTTLCGGQWQRENGELVLKVIDNSLYPEIQLTGSYQPGNATQK